MKQKKLDLRTPKFKNGKILTAKDLNDLWKDVERIKRRINLKP